MIKYPNLGAAKKQANENAKRDNCIWIVWHNTNGFYNIADEFAIKDYWWDKVAYTAKPQKEQIVSKEAVILTPEERQLVAAVLDPQEPGRDYYPGEEKTKVSLWKKLTGGNLANP